jgi:hypothetical protein
MSPEIAMTRGDTPEKMAEWKCSCGCEFEREEPRCPDQKDDPDDKHLVTRVS